MKKYSYYNWDYSRKTVYVGDGWNQFHTCCAQYRHFTLDDIDAMTGEITRSFIVDDFVSFDMPICRVWFDTRWNTYYVTINDEYFNCSNRTIHQFSRWLNENKFPFAYHDIKQLSLMKKSGTTDISTVSFKKDIHFSYCTVDYMLNHVINW